MSPLSEFELHPDRLATTDADGNRIFIYPSDVKGRFRNRRTIVHTILLMIFLTLPWLRINGRQALLLDISNRRFDIFGLPLRAHNAPLFVLVLGAGAFGLFFATAVFGRAWCGWACPQTVFIDNVFRRIERWIEGPAFKRRLLDKGDWTAEKIWKKSLKWITYLALTLIITHSLLAYLVGTDRLPGMISRPPSENWGTFLFMGFLTTLILFDFAWFREQFCTIVCPYGRFQSVLMDKNSMVVGYDQKRGEPRASPQAKMLAKNHNSSLGDCVNCYRCVQVCPTGIDIRRGVQMECIACTACIDACDEVMTKIKKPRGLIAYRAPFLTSGSRMRVSSRAAVYFSLGLASAIALAWLLIAIKPIGVEVLRAKEAPYSVQALPDGSESVINHFRIELSNQSSSDRELLLTIPDAPAGLQIISAQRSVKISAGDVLRDDIFIKFPKSILQRGQIKVRLMVNDAHPSEDASETETEVLLVGPFS